MDSNALAQLPKPGSDLVFTRSETLAAEARQYVAGFTQSMMKNRSILPPVAFPSI
ncbi:hypothetical protein [Alkalilimnicola ehrlichii]|uniref:hypothetical protein n=1 Tax=Alkalilimnicola ehrlichii TaxID=351052 RepID=UPI0026796082|nr:hypothetical protein [Alkalilimnicola ehrlichii]